MNSLHSRSRAFFRAKSLQTTSKDLVSFSGDVSLQSASIFSLLTLFGDRSALMANLKRIRLDRERDSFPFLESDLTRLFCV